MGAIIIGQVMAHKTIEHNLNVLAIFCQKINPILANVFHII